MMVRMKQEHSNCSEMATRWMRKFLVLLPMHKIAEMQNPEVAPPLAPLDLGRSARIKHVPQ